MLQERPRGLWRGHYFELMKNQTAFERLQGEIEMKKKPYEKPIIVASESLETRAVICTKTDTAACGGTISSG